MVHELKYILPQLNIKNLARYVQQQFYPEYFALKDEQIMFLSGCNLQEIVQCFSDLLVTLELNHLGLYEFVNVKARFDWATGRIVPIPEVDTGYFFRLVKPKKLKTKILATLNQRKRHINHA